MPVIPEGGGSDEGELVAPGDTHSVPYAWVALVFYLMCKQVPVPNLPAGVHEAGKSVEKADAIFSQERDPRFAEMFAGISACKFPNGTEVLRVWGLQLLSGHLPTATVSKRGPRKVSLE